MQYAPALIDIDVIWIAPLVLGLGLLFGAGFVQADPQRPGKVRLKKWLKVAGWAFLVVAALGGVERSAIKVDYPRN